MKIKDLNSIDMHNICMKTRGCKKCILNDRINNTKNCKIFDLETRLRALSLSKDEHFQEFLEKEINII